MYLVHKAGNVHFLREVRLCYKCCRMFELNLHAHIWARCDNRSAYSHLVCPPAKPDPLILRLKGESHGKD